jgi:hypothetical protein
VPKSHPKRMPDYFNIFGGSLKKMEKKIIPKVPTKRNVYTKASIESFLNCCNEISRKFTKTFIF